MGLRSLFMRRRSAVGTAASAVVVGSEPEHQEPLTPEQLAELQEAWAELANAAEGSGVTGLHACSRTGGPWQEDPVAVRGLAATLRSISSDKAQ
ncbi:hypothetical protein C9424_19650 [Arthrobacter sp. H-02-3]|nr:hypothetical protein C9424_19650 [Arthrobacter sp. H-02-3]